MAWRSQGVKLRSIMGWMRTLLLGDIGNRLDIADAEREIASLKSIQRTSAGNLGARDSRVRQLQEELGRQKLAIQALTRFLVTKGVVSESELDEFIEEVDAEDGVIDGQMTLNPASQKLAFPKRKAGAPPARQIDRWPGKTQQ